MSRTKLLLEVVQDIQALGNSLQVLAEALMAGEPQVQTKEEEMPFDTSNIAINRARLPSTTTDS